MLIWILVIVLLSGILPQTVMQLPSEVEAAGIIPEDLITVYAGDRMELTIPGEYAIGYQTTNVTFQSKGNTVAHIWAYDNDYKNAVTEEEKAECLIFDSYVCHWNYADILYNALAGYKIFIEVQYGAIVVKYNTANHHEVPRVEEGGCEKLNWLVQGTIHEGYLTVGETASFDIAAVQSGYNAAVVSYYSSASLVAGVDDDGTIRAKKPGTAVITMKYIFYTSSLNWFEETISCIINVVEDYSMEASSASYYAEGEDKYFNIVAYDEMGNRENGFYIEVGEELYYTAELY